MFFSWHHVRFHNPLENIEPRTVCAVCGIMAHAHKHKQAERETHSLTQTHTRKQDPRFLLPTAHQIHFLCGSFLPPPSPSKSSPTTRREWRHPLSTAASTSLVPRLLAICFPFLPPSLLPSHLPITALPTHRTVDMVFIFLGCAVLPVPRLQQMTCMHKIFNLYVSSNMPVTMNNLRTTASWVWMFSQYSQRWIQKATVGRKEVFMECDYNL